MEQTVCLPDIGALPHQCEVKTGPFSSLCSFGVQGTEFLLHIPSLLSLLCLLHKRLQSSKDTKIIRQVKWDLFGYIFLTGPSQGVSWASEHAPTKVRKYFGNKIHHVMIHTVWTIKRM